MSGCGHENCGCQSGSASEASPLDQLENETGFHPMGEDWEDEMREMLEDTDYDADLGMEMARDAMRLTAGEIEEEEFYEQYNEAMVEEFGEDDRPVAEALDLDDPDDGSIVDSLREMANGDASRRETMKKGAFAAGSLGLGGLFGGGDDDEPSTDGTVAAQSDEEGDNRRFGMVIDTQRCDGCLECVVGCMEENKQDRGANWMYVITWHDENTDQTNFLTRPCQHCSNAPCAKVCPVQARHIRKDGGFVLTNYETCIGCRYCQVACPYGVNYFQWGHPEIPREEINTGDHGLTGDELRELPAEERHEVLQNSGDHVHDKRGWEVDSRGRIGTMGKCTFCPSRQDGNLGEDMVGTVACMDACDEAGMSAIHFGDFNDPNSRPNRYLELAKEIEPSTDEKIDNIENPEEDWQNPPAPHPEQQLSAFRLLEDIGTQPNILYLGNEPGEHAEQIEGPIDYGQPPVDETEDGVPVMDKRIDATEESTVGVPW